METVMTTFESRTAAVPGWEAYRAAIRVAEQLLRDNPQSKLVNARSEKERGDDNSR
jgi:hypothetical protein